LQRRRKNLVVVHTESEKILSESDVVKVRQLVRSRGTAARLSLVDLTKLVTAASEIARNTLIYGKGGELILRQYLLNGRKAIELTFVDQGPGIPDVAQALTDGYTSGGGMGLGLGGAKRLVDKFEIETAPGRGTRIILTKWH
jgi:serine/threonine-protein kinase RsbT